MEFEIIPRDYEGKFIVFDGPDYAGKGTQTMMAVNYLYGLSKENEFLLTREPSMLTDSGREIRKLFSKMKNPYDNAEELLKLFLKNRAELLSEFIIPNLYAGRHVLDDRHKYSTTAYQGTQGISMQRIADAHKDILIPNLAIILTLNLDEWLKRRMLDKTHKEVFDQAEIEFTSSLLDKYFRMKEFYPNENIKIISGEQTKEAIHAQIVEELDKVFQK